MTELKLPSLGEGIEQGTVISIMVKVGDTVGLEQTLIEVETDKVVVEVPSDAAGTISEILVNIGDAVSEGTSIVKVDSGAESSTDSVVEETAEEPMASVANIAAAVVEAPKKAKKATASKETELKLPDLGEGIEKGTIIAISVKKGDVIEAEQILMEVETDKVVVEVPAEIGGTVNKVLVAVGDEISQGVPIISLQADGEVLEEVVEAVVETPVAAPVVPVAKKSEVKKEVPKVVEAAPQIGSRKNGFRTSPLARKIAREIGIDISTMPLTGGSKRISVKDVKNYAKMLNENRASGGSIQMATAPSPNFSKWGEVRNEAMTGIMQATSKNMTTSWSQIPHAWLQEKVDITYLEAQRQNHKHAIKEKGGALTITGILVKVIAKALEEFPIFNASLDSQNASLVYKDFINIGVAVDTDRGLLVPVLKNAHTKDMTQIAIELATLANKVKSKKISAEELDGGTFTISNLGGIGTTSIFPLVSHPQVAILGVAASKTEAVHIDGQFQPRLMMPLTIGFDHRVINGADAARFLQYVKQLLEDWLMWSL